MVKPTLLKRHAGQRYTIIHASYGGVHLALIRVDDEALSPLRKDQWRIEVWDYPNAWLDVKFDVGVDAIATFERWWNSLMTEGTRLWPQEQGYRIG